MFIGLLSFSKSLASKFMSSNNKQSHARYILIELNPVNVTYYPFINFLDKFNGNCNTLDKTSGRICVPNKTKDVNLSVSN